MMTPEELQKTLSRMAELKPIWRVELQPGFHNLTRELEANGKTAEGFTILLIRTDSDVVSIKIADAAGGIICHEGYSKDRDLERAHYQVLEKVIVDICQRQFDANKAAANASSEVARRSFFSN